MAEFTDYKNTFTAAVCLQPLNTILRWVFHLSTSLTLYPWNSNVIVLRNYDGDRKKGIISAKGPIWSACSLSSLVYLGFYSFHKNAFCIVYKWSHSLWTRHSFSSCWLYLSCGWTRHIKWIWFQCRIPKEDSCSTSVRPECTDSRNAFWK